MVYWLYREIPKPRYLHSAIVWWPTTQLKVARGDVENMIIIGITGFIRTTPIGTLVATVWQAELSAILICAQNMLEGMVGQQIRICVDS